MQAYSMQVGIRIVAILLVLLSGGLLLPGASITLRRMATQRLCCVVQVEALAGVPLLLAPELLERGVDHQPLYVSLHNAELDVACEALAQGMATWWLRTAQDRIYLLIRYTFL